MSGRLTISLAAIVQNYQTLRAGIESAGVGASEATGIAGVVKANAYGLGLEQVSEALYIAGCRSYFVATASEAVQLRCLLDDVNIFVFNGVTPSTLEELLDSRITPVLNTQTQIECWNPTGKPGAIHIDTGMERLGLGVSQVRAATANLQFEPVLLLSHFARADEQDPDVAQRQTQAFETATTELRRRYPTVRLSFSNSAATLAGGVGDDLCRPGIALYGGNPYVHADNPMQPTVTLEGQVLQIREVAEGTAVGYGGSFVTSRTTRIASIGVGYADGVPRLLSNNGNAVLRGQRCPIVGRVSMDMVQVDVTDVEGIVEGSWAELVGDGIGIDEVAEQAQTIGYEVLTGLDAARRLERVYT
jgi:alanine racemase